MKASRFTQKLHKWLGLLVGIQLVIWSISGFYMVVVSIDIIHGDHLVQSPKPLSRADLATFSTQLDSIVKANPQAKVIALKSLHSVPVLELQTAASTQLITLDESANPTIIDDEAARRLAYAYYAGTGQIETMTLIERDPPREIGARALPLWRADFDDIWGSTLYISPVTGALATRRHTLWRVFDFFWMLHIMDYDEREDINNTLLRIVSMLAFLLVLSGVWYLYFRLNVKAWFNRGAR